MYINEQDKQVKEYLKAINVEYQAIPIQQDAIDDNNWKHDKWLVIFNDKSFEYHTGVGHRICIFGSGTREQRENVNALRKLTGFTKRFPVTKELRRNPSKTSIDFEAYALAVPPTQASVLYSLLFDSDAANFTFRNWCDTYGYDTDSKKAERIYFSCQENADKLHSVFSIKHIKKLRELLEDY